MIGIFLLLSLIRLPLLLSDQYLTIPELNWMLVGEKLSAPTLLYVGVWDNIAPFSAFIYCIIDFLFGRSQLAYVIVAIFLTTIQSGIFNSFLLRIKAFNENTYIPALVYALLSCCFFDFFTLSPVLLSLTWILLAIRNIFYQVESESRDTNILGTGLLLGIASLFYLPSVVFLFSTIFSYILFSNLSIRKYLLLLYGLLLPVVLVSIIFYWFNGLSHFVNQFFLSFFSINNKPFLSIYALLFIGFLPLVIFLMAIVTVSQHSIRYTNYQSRLQRTMLAMLAGAVLSLFFIKERSAYHMLFLVPPMAFYITHFLLNVERKLLAEAYVVLLLFYLVIVNYGGLYNLFSINSITETEKLLVQPTDYDAKVSGKKILVLGDDLNIYNSAQLATPYLNWRLSIRQLRALDYYDNLSEVYINFNEDMPEIIIDNAQLLPSLTERIPMLKNAYRKEGTMYYLNSD